MPTTIVLTTGPFLVQVASSQVGATDIVYQADTDLALYLDCIQIAGDSTCGVSGLSVKLGAADPVTLPVGPNVAYVLPMSSRSVGSLPLEITMSTIATGKAYVTVVGTVGPAPGTDAPALRVAGIAGAQAVPTSGTTTITGTVPISAAGVLTVKPA